MGVGGGHRWRCDASWVGAPHTAGPRKKPTSRDACQAGVLLSSTHGNAALDSFRLYEASKTGAHPCRPARRRRVSTCRDE